MPETPSPVNSTLDPVITIDGKDYTIKKFVTAKFLRATKLVTKLLDESDVVSLFGDNNRENYSTVLIKKIPQLLETSEEYVMQLCALVLTSNAELRRMEENDESVDNHLATFAKELRYAEIDKIVETVVVGIEQMGVKALQKNVQRLQSLFRRQE